MRAASVQVVFSRKLLVWRTPITLPAPPNCDDRPPPLDFWMRTMPMSMTATMTVRTMIATYISDLLLFNHTMAGTARASAPAGRIFKLQSKHFFATFPNICQNLVVV